MVWKITVVPKPGNEPGQDECSTFSKPGHEKNQNGTRWKQPEKRESYLGAHGDGGPSSERHPGHARGLAVAAEESNYVKRNHLFKPWLNKKTVRKLWKEYGNVPGRASLNVPTTIGTVQIRGRGFDLGSFPEGLTLKNTKKAGGKSSTKQYFRNN